MGMRLKMKTKWEYKVCVWDKDTFEEFLNKLGYEGWEVILITSQGGCFPNILAKRPLD